MYSAHKIAVLGRDVHILYVAENGKNSGLLIFFYSSEGRKFSSIADVIYYGSVRSAGKDYGKKHGILVGAKYCTIALVLHFKVVFWYIPVTPKVCITQRRKLSYEY